MKRLAAVSALVVGVLGVVFLLGVVIAALTTQCAPIGLGLQQAAAAGPTAPREAFSFSAKLPPKAAPGSKTVVSWPGSCGRADVASVAYVNDSRQPSKAKRVVSWPSSCGRADRASVAFMDLSERSAKAAFA